MKPPVLLRIYFNEKLEGVRQFVESQIVIGRNPEAQVNLPEESVSPLHAVIEERDSGYYLSDLGSQAGTFKNGERVLDQELSSGDEIKIGPYKLQFFIGVPKPAAPPSVHVAEKPAAPPATSSSTQEVKPIPEPEQKEEINFKPATAVPPIIPGKKFDAPEASTPSADAETPEVEETTKIKESPKFEKPFKPKISEPAPVEVNPSPTKVVAQPAKEYPVGPVLSSPVGKKTKGNTFAPPSAYKSAKEMLKPGKGTVIEVSVAWRERIISTHSFKEKQSVTIGAGKNADVFIPLLSSKTTYELFKIGGNVTVFLSPEMTGEFITSQNSSSFSELLKMNRLRNRSGGYELDLGQGEMVRVGLQGDLISIFIRYVPEAPKPLVAPLLDLTASEFTGVVLATVVAGIFGLYMMVYAPTSLQDEDRIEETLRKATVTFNAPPPKQRVEVTEKVKVEVTEKPVEKKTQPVRTTKTPSVEKAGKPGKAAEVKPKKTTDLKKQVTSARAGGSRKTAPKEGANAQSQKPDPSKVGLLGVFGSKGTQDKLDQAYSGSGELIGMAEAATGVAGSAEDRAGDRLGTKLRDTGAGGKGSATVGIAGVGTQGKGTGGVGYGEGGIGTKGSVEIDVGGQEAEIAGSIDREAIRRVIQANKSAIRFCYDSALQRDRDLFGKLVLEWDIAEQGRVTRAVVKSSTLNNNSVANCIIKKLKTWKFPEPPPNQVAVVSYPFVFTAQ